jgi:hypothetical protein
MRLAVRCFSLLLLALALMVAVTPVESGEPKWLELLGEKWQESWKPPLGEWFLTDSVGLDQENTRKLKAKPAKGDILVNSTKGRTRDLHTKQNFGDIELHAEFLIAKKSNSGIKFHDHYEIQILDSHGKTTKLTGDDCGGIYPRAELLPSYRHIDEGVAPKVNAAKPAGEWQTLDVIFLAPRFDQDGKKIANARIVKAVLNGQVIHENSEFKTPTGSNYKNKEKATGPLMLQGDHGPVAFRNVRVREYQAKKE